MSRLTIQDNNSSKTITVATGAGVNHTHVIADVAGLQTALDSKQASGDYATNTALTNGLATKANTSHTHAIADVTNLQTTLDGKAASVHIHDIADVYPNFIDKVGFCSDPTQRVVHLGLGTSYGSGTKTLANQRIHLQIFQVSSVVTIKGLTFFTDNTAAGATPTLVKFGLYAMTSIDTAFLLAQTANDTTIFSQTVTRYSRTFASPVTSITLVPGRWYAAGVLVNSSAAMPVLAATPSLRTVLQGLNTQCVRTGAATDLIGMYANTFAGETNAAVCYALHADYKTPPLDSALIGDSIISSYAGWWQTGNFNAGSKFHPTVHSGVGGNTLANIISRWATDITPYFPQWVWLHAGTNDIFSEFASASTIISRYQSIINLCAGRKLVICTPPSNTASSSTTRQVLSDVRSYLLSLNVANVYVVDTGITLTTGDGITADASKLVDTVHPNATGIAAMGAVITTFINGLNL